MKKHLAVAMAAAGLAAATTAQAQSSVTLYGVIDNGIVYQNSSTSRGSTTGGHSAVTMSNGAWAGSRFGLQTACRNSRAGCLRARAGSV
jgi:predicted porin